MEKSRGGRRFGFTLTLVFAWFVIFCVADTGSRDDAFVGYSEVSFKRSNVIKSFRDARLSQKEYLVFSTKFGDITVELAGDIAPKSVNYVKSLVSQGLMDGCSFYRAEPAGPTIDEGRDNIRPGYALLQGGLYSCGRQETKELPVESALNNTKGTVALITGTSEFFFNLEAHSDWDGSFSVWGKVVGFKSWNVLRRIIALPTRQETHSSGTVLRMLLNQVIYKVRLETPAPS